MNFLAELDYELARELDRVAPVRTRQRSEFIRLGELEKDGISVEIVDLRTLRPVDEDAILTSVRKTNRAVICEEGWPWAGVGGSIVDLIQKEAFDDLDAPVLRVTGLDVNMSYAANLEAATQPDAEKIKAAVKQVLYR